MENTVYIEVKPRAKDSEARRYILEFYYAHFKSGEARNIKFSVKIIVFSKKGEGQLQGDIFGRIVTRMSWLKNIFNYYKIFP